MMLTNRFSRSALGGIALTLSLLIATPTPLTAADASIASEKDPVKLIAVLQSDAPPADKAITCKQLAIYGNQDAVPALAPLLQNAELSSWARIALEAIPGPAADAALRQAMDKVQGKLLIGVMNSIAVRRDTNAVEGLIAKMGNSDAEVASAAAVALGRIGGPDAAKALLAALTSGPAAARSGVAEGCILCAEQMAARGKPGDAVMLYDAVRKADVVKPRILDATRGAIVARQASGIPLLLETLRSPDKALFSVALRAARELPGRKVTETLVAELDRTAPERQSLLLLAVADRRDDAVLPAMLKAANSGPTALRIVALGELERLGNVSCVPMLLDIASGGDAALATAATTTLARLPGDGVDTDILRRLPPATGRKRQVLVELAGLRQIDAALPAVVQSAQDADAGVRAAAVGAIGIMGGASQSGDLAKLLQATQKADERANLEKALMAVSRRGGPACVPHLLPLMKSADSALRTIALHALASVGGAEALAAVRSASEDADTAVQDEAVRTLSAWPSTWPDDTAVAEALLNLARNGKKTSHQVLGVRGYLQYVQGSKQLSDAEKAAKVAELLTVIKRPEEKRLVVSTVAAIPSNAALELLASLTSEADIAEEACSAIVALADRNLRGVSKAQRVKALQTAAERTKNPATKAKADEVIKGIQ